MPSKNSITEHTLFKRVKKALLTSQSAGAAKRLNRCRYNSRWFNELGRYYLVGLNNYVSDRYVDLQDLARELNVLRPDEAVIPE